MSNPFTRFIGYFRQNGRALRHDESAATVVEFGLLAFPFFLIVGGLLQTSVLFLAANVLDSAVQDATRQIRTGQFQTSGATLATFRTQVCDKLFGLFPDCSGLHLRVVEVTNFQSANVVEPVDRTCTTSCNWTVPESWTPGAGRSVILVQAHYRYPVVLPFGPLGMANLADGNRLMGMATVFQNEPF
ncbi:TadE/TadG family type IV pilus assembly protein [Devosia faecipullorum]|uniref:TadE/TadG family type IV pilus assembly protein n=1 Tax=Devosia faecipullorum TaxID=2755039 RepID=UPI00187BC154|nr:TadE/TadG family type IV pilus assembly protein [Devosia faecipullorum]MBE7734213.1 pilus assembly protein [Devosia faecipullorum]